MPKKNKRKSGTGEPPKGALGSALGGFFGGGGDGAAGGGGMFGGVENAVGGMFGSPKKEPFGKASAMAMEEDSDDNDDGVAAAQEQQKKDAAEQEAKEAEAQAKKQEEEIRKRKEEEEREAERERIAAAARLAEEQEEERHRAAAAAAAAAAAEATRKREAEQAAAAKKKAEDLKAEERRKQQQRALQSNDSDRPKSIPKPVSSTGRPNSSSGLGETPLDKANELLLQHSSKWEVRVKVNDVMAASWVSHTQARTLMQQLRLRLLTTPPRWHPSERPNLATVVAAGLAELGDVDTCDKILSDTPPERITYSNDSVHARVQL